jgi:hypothetical protein
MVFNKLKVNPDFNIVLVDATSTTTDYTTFEAIVMSSVPASTAAGYAALEAVNKPKLLLKPFTLKSTVWNWINTTNAVNTPQTGVTILNRSHPIFTGLTFSGTNNDELQLFTSVTTNAVTGITNSTWIATPAVSVLGNALTSTTTNSVVEIPVGTNMNGTTTGRRFVMIGLSEYSMANLTTIATQLIENTVYYILELDVPNPLPVNFYSVNIIDKNGVPQLNWKVGNEFNIKKYEIQRSENGTNFTTIAAINANGSNDYSWNDFLVISGRIFYRIAAIEISGSSSLSQVLPFNKSKQKSTITVVPNPITDKKINLQLFNIEKGMVYIHIYDHNGKDLLVTTFYNNGGLFIKTIQLPAAFPSGVYTIKSVSSEGNIFTQSVIIK